VGLCFVIHAVVGAMPTTAIKMVCGSENILQPSWACCEFISASNMPTAIRGDGIYEKMMSILAHDNRGHGT
jgi:hypothetical protein